MDDVAKMSNQVFLDHVTSSDNGMQKRAADTVNDFTRVKMREEGFARRILPPIQISGDELDRQVDTDKPVKVVDKEPDSPAAMMIPYATTPMGRYIRGPRYRVMFARIASPKFNKDVSELRTYHMDIRQVISDNAIKDMLAEEDGKFIYATNALLVGSGSTVPETSTIQWKEISGGITRANLAESLKIMPGTPSKLHAATCLTNHITILDILKWHHDEVGGELAQEMLLQGYTERNLFGRRFIITNKTDLVPDNTVMQYAEPKNLGKFYMLEDATMFMKNEAYMIEFFCYEELGGAIGNVAGVARADFPASSS